MRGSHIAYVQTRNITDIWRADLTAAHPEDTATKLIYSTRAQLNPRYSDDGKHIAFQSNRSGNTEIWLTDSDGADPVRLTSFNGPFTDTPSWCSDGRRIAFDSSASGSAAVYVEDIAERLPRKVITSRTDLSGPVWSPDCRWLLASIEDKARLYRFPSAGGPAELFTTRPAYYPMVLADRVIFSVKEPTGVVLWSKSLGGGAEVPVAGMPQLGYGDAWAANSTGIYYTDVSSEQTTVHLYEFATQKTRLIMTLGRGGPVPAGGYGMAVSADGRYLLYTQVDDLQSDIMLGPSP
jgi:Tol biopolymer transport system component